MSFRDMVAADNFRVFSNLTEFADLHTIVYDGLTYTDVPCVVSNLKAKDRPVLISDHAQGLYQVVAIVHFPADALCGIVPEKGTRFDMSNDDGFLMRYYVSQVSCDLGMVRLELEAYDE